MSDTQKGGAGHGGTNEGATHPDDAAEDKADREGSTDPARVLRKDEQAR